MLILPLPLKDHEVHGQNKPPGTEKSSLSMSPAVVLHYTCPWCPMAQWMSAFELLLVKKRNCTTCMWVTSEFALDAITALVTHIIRGNCSHSEVHDQRGYTWKPPWIPTEQNCSGICDMRRSLKAAWLAVCAGSRRVKWFGMSIISSKLCFEEVNLSLFEGLIKATEKLSMCSDSRINAKKHCEERQSSTIFSLCYTKMHCKSNIKSFLSGIASLTF